MSTILRALAFLVFSASCVMADSRGELRRLSGEQAWVDRAAPPPLDRATLGSAVEGARVYLLNHQRAEGNFAHEFTIVTGRVEGGDSQTRQAGALWSLATLCRQRPTHATRHGVTRGLDFFFRISHALPMGQIAPVYPGADTVETAAVALASLAIIESIRAHGQAAGAGAVGLHESWLTQYLDTLQRMELDDGSWGAHYLLASAERDAGINPYADGAALLAYCRAARWMGHQELVPRIRRIAPQLAVKYTVDAWENDPNPLSSRSFAPLGVLAFRDAVEAGWDDAGLFGDAALALAWWLVHEHAVLQRDGNSAAAVEALLAAAAIARKRADAASAERLETVAEQLLRRLLPLQVGGPREKDNRFLRTLPRPPLALGGIMTARDSGVVRLDAMQHQLHAMLMMLDQMFPDKGGR